MFCEKCGCQLADDATVCTNCGAPTQTQQNTAPGNDAGAQNAYSAQQPNGAYQPPVQTAYPQNPVAARYNTLFSDALFLVACICVSVGAVFSVFSGSWNILSILFTIFMWLIYASAKNGSISSKYMRCVSGTVYAMRICLWVAIGIFGLCALICLFIPGVFANLLSEYNAFSSFEYGFAALSLSSVLGFVLCFILLIVVAVLIVLNILFYGPLHKLAKGLYTAVDTGVEQLPNIGAIKTWALVIGILCGVGALINISNGFLSFVASGAEAAVYIVISVWLNKHFVRVA